MSIAHLGSILVLLSLLGMSHSSTSSTVSDRIVGGDPIYTPVPYQASLQLYRNDKWSHYCGGVVISPNHIITAAHCVTGQDPRNISVVVGTTSLSSAYGSRHFVAIYNIHENYSQFRNDIAIIRVIPSFDLNNTTIGAINFRQNITFGAGVPLILTGWGSIYQSGSGPLPDQLRRLVTFTLSNDQCRTFYLRLENTQMCTLRSLQKGACNGDSGGPLVTYDSKNVVGLVSFGSRICGSGSPDYFTRVSEFVGWISQQMTIL